MRCGVLLGLLVAVRAMPEMMVTYRARTTSTQVSPHHTIDIQSAVWFDSEIGQRSQARSRIDGADWGRNSTELVADELHRSFAVDTPGCPSTPLASSPASFGLSKLGNFTLLGSATVNGLNCSHWQLKERSMLQELTTDAYLHRLTQGPETGRWHAVRVSEVWTDGAGSYPSTTNWTDVHSLIGLPMGSEEHLFDLPLVCSANKTCSSDSDCPQGTNSICCGNGECAADVRQGCRCLEGCAGDSYCCSSGVDIGWCRHSCNR